MSIAGKAFGGFSLLLSLVGLGAQSPETPRIAAFICNYAAIPFEVLAQTETEAARICQFGGVGATSSQVFGYEPSSSGVPAECLNIHLYNLAGVSSHTLDHATQDAARILATAGVNLVCWRVLADAPEAHIVDMSVTPTRRKKRQTDSRRYLVVIVERGFPDNYLPDELGFALPDAQVGVSATVFYDRIERLHESAEIDLAILLGHAMAHEIGHVLLGTTEHSTAGIMKARWSEADFQVAGLRFMTFTPLERAEVRRRGLIARQRPPRQPTK